MRARWALFVGLLAALNLAQSPPLRTAPNDDEMRELEARLDTLQREIDQLAAAQEPAQRESLMQRSWQSMQEYMGWMHQRWGAGGPWMMSRGMMQTPGASSCPMLGGAGAPWPPPPGVTPEQYAQQMGAHMQRMREQMQAIAQASKPADRERLLQEHWQTMYRDMESMRGRGWMSGNAPLPDAGSAGAKLVSEYCTNCHAAPPPTLHTTQEWTDVIGRMEGHRADAGAGAGVRMPDAEQRRELLAYLQTHAR
jgi:hypothetical protein